MLKEASKKILIVDDDPSHRLMLKATLKKEGYEIYEADDGARAVRMVEDGFYDLIMMDLKMKQVGGIEALKRIKEISPVLPVLIMTAYASVRTAVDALKIGAFDYLTKPLDMDEVLRTISDTLDAYPLKVDEKLFKDPLPDRFDFSKIIGKSRKMREIFEILMLSAPSNATILILGESGTGKERIADAIHQNSLRSDKPFIKVNCAALSEHLLESELFGHERGAFTGATHRRLGRFELADGGTLFLDEIGDMSPSTQAKILRVLQEGEFERVGGEKTLQVDVRILVATNRDLEKDVQEGRFRRDLYFRLSVVPIHLPPLRERKEDIPLLAEHFLKLYAEKNRRLIKGFTPRAMDLMMRYEWGGNIRELENTVERAVIMSRDVFITPAELPMAIQALSREVEESNTGVQAGHSIKQVERELIIKTLEETSGNRTRAAEILGITRQTLQNKLREYGEK